MADKPKENILVSPEYSMLMFGDGYTALIQGGIEGKDDDEKKIVDFVLKPSKLLRKRYNITTEMLNQNMNMDFRVLKKDLIPLNLLDDANKKWLYIKNLNHDETELGRRDWSLREQLAEEERRVVILEGENIFLSEQLQLARTNPSEFIAQGAEVWEKIMKQTTDIMRGKRERDED